MPQTSRRRPTKASHDLHKKESQICIFTEDGEVIEKRILTQKHRFHDELGKRKEKVRILIEASTESEWVARCLEELGHEVIVADPNFAPMYATRSKKIKTDKRDAQALADACRLGAYRPAHRLSREAHELRVDLGIQQVLVESRTKLIVVVRSLLRYEGMALGSCEGSPASCGLLGPGSIRKEDH